MTLSNAQTELLRLWRSLDGRRRFALAGGGAMIAHQPSDRTTGDLDLFTSDMEAVEDQASRFITEIET